MSAKPRVKLSPRSRPSVRSTHLRVVVHSPRHPKSWGPYVWAILLLFCSTLAYTWMVGRTYFSAPSEWTAASGISQLASAYKTEGIEGYLIAKARLREAVREQLRHAQGDPRRGEAENVAVYLFPDLLDDTHFEKMESQQLFAPFIDVIESRPRTDAAVEAFDALENEIWNYENISRQDPQISDAASEFLKTLSELARG